MGTTSGGLYTAPANSLNPSTVTVTATSVADTTKSASATVTIVSGGTVTVTPSSATVAAGQSFQFTATVTNNPNTAVTWQVNSITGGNTTVGTITQAGLYTAPASVASQTSVTVTAVLQADNTRTGSATVTIVPQGAATLSAVSPTTIAQGSLFEDLYLTGTNFLSASAALVDNNPAPTFFISTTILRARVPANLLSVTGLHDVAVCNPLPTSPCPSGQLSGVVRVTVVPVRPALVSASPESGLQTGAPFSVNFDGGYYSSSITADFNENLPPSSLPATVLNSRQLSAVVPLQDLGTAGLFAMRLRNTAAAPSTPLLAAVNLAVVPASVPSLTATLPVGSQPSAVAVNTATGIAVVVNQGSNTVSLVDLKTGLIVGSPIPVGSNPTGVAIDNLRNLALVVNNASNSVSVIDLSLAPPQVTTTITSGIQALPFSVGVNPLSGLALATYQNSSSVSVLDLTLSPPTVVNTATVVTTGLSPQVAVEPRLNWAIVTPGGTGTVSIVSLDRIGRTAVTNITASPNGAVRSNNVVTITTTAAHGLTVGETITIAGVTDTSFNGTFSVASVPSSTSFTYNQTAGNATSGNGTVSAAAPLVTVALNPSLQGIGLNTETERALLVDPASTSITLFSILDQSVNTLVLETGHVAAAVNPLTNVGVSVNPIANQASVIDLRTPQRLATLSVGTNPQAVAIDPASNTAIVVNKGSNNVSLIQLGTIRALQVTQVSPATTIAPSSNVSLTVIGGGFLPGAVVRVDETELATTIFVNSRRLTATVPLSMLARPRQFAVDVKNPGPDFSDVASFTVIQTVPVGTAPAAVAIEPDLNLAVVANSGSANATLVDLNSLSAKATLNVGKNPQGVAVLSRAGRAVVTNSTDGTATILDLNAGAVSTTVTVGTNPLGVAIHPGTGQAVVANNGAQSLSFFSVENPGSPTSLTVDHGPLAVAVDPTRNIAAVTHGTDNDLVIVDLAGAKVTNRITGFQLPTGVVYDPAPDCFLPASDCFLVVSSLTNNLLAVQPDTGATTPVRVGINPTSVAYNYRSSTLVTVNSSSQTFSVMDFLTQRVRAILPLSGSLQFSVAIQPRTNLAVVVDQTNNRVLVVPLPR
jgi:DNA-binding beta-propeller fold protein YncE